MSHHNHTETAESQRFSVNQCRCGQYHLHIGAVTLNFNPQMFSALVETMNRVLVQSYAGGQRQVPQDNPTTDTWTWLAQKQKFQFDC